MLGGGDLHINLSISAAQHTSARLSAAPQRVSPEDHRPSPPQLILLRKPGGVQDIKENKINILTTKTKILQSH